MVFGSGMGAIIFVSTYYMFLVSPLDGVVLESPLDARGDTGCSKDESDIVTGYLLYVSWSMLADF